VNQFTSLTLIVGLLLAPISSLATPCPAESNPLVEGQNSPCTGVLLSPTGVAKIIADKQKQKEQCDLNISKTKEEAGAHCNIQISSLTLQINEEQENFGQELENRNEEIKSLQKIINSQNKPKHGMWFAVGTVSGVALTILTAWAIGQVTNN